MFTNTLRSSLSFAVILGALFYSTLALAVPPIKVELGVVEVTDPVTLTVVDTLTVISNDKPCDGTAAGLSCIVVAKGNKPFIVFNLPDACKKDIDGNPVDGSPVYELIGMKIAQIKKDWPTPDNPLNKKIASDFKADPETGEINFNYGENNRKPWKLKFKNRNNNAYSVFYKITAAPCDDESNDPDITLDPEIRNRG